MPQVALSVQRWHCEASVGYKKASFPCTGDLATLLLLVCKVIHQNPAMFLCLEKSYFLFSWFDFSLSPKLCPRICFGRPAIVLEVAGAASLGWGSWGVSCLAGVIVFLWQVLEPSRLRAQ